MFFQILKQSRKIILRGKDMFMTFTTPVIIMEGWVICEYLKKDGIAMVYFDVNLNF